MRYDGNGYRLERKMNDNHDDHGRFAAMQGSVISANKATAKANKTGAKSDHLAASKAHQAAAEATAAHGKNATGTMRSVIDNVVAKHNQQSEHHAFRSVHG